ncbi:hypothetical protein SNE40_001509 [Patella caerulea]|uniref:Uncharacterized protein n=1 Tax=Patella caerulea TaxID=87958 RepID=A0AAN8KEP8_PATCE
MQSLVFALSLLFLKTDLSNCLQCLDYEGKPVDWFVVYKLPELEQNKSSPILHGGLGHFYLDANNPEFQLSKYSLNSSNDAIYYTLQQIYTAKDDSILYGMYNDEPPNNYGYFTNGHTKGRGVIASDESQGYWLVHSVPKYPPHKNESYTWPESATVYGQNFLCITINYTTIDKIGEQYLYNYPKFYDKCMPPQFTKHNPNMVKAFAGLHVKSPPWNNMAAFSSSGGTQFHSFAKFCNFERDLYDAWLAPYFNSTMFAETWQNGRGKLPSNCSAGFKVLNVRNISLPEGIKFTETKDHSKWAITRDDGNWVCIGDINREEPQEKRAGGTVCFQHKDVWKNYNNSILDVQNCSPRYSVVNL